MLVEGRIHKVTRVPGFFTMTLSAAALPHRPLEGTLGSPSAARAKTSRSTEAVFLKVTEGASRGSDLDQFDAMPMLWRRPQNAKVTRVAHSLVTLHL